MENFCVKFRIENPQRTLVRLRFSRSFAWKFPQLFSKLRDLFLIVEYINFKNRGSVQTERSEVRIGATYRLVWSTLVLRYKKWKLRQQGFYKLIYFTI